MTIYEKNYQKLKNLNLLLTDKDHLKVENAPYMSLSLDLISTDTLAMCHYGEQNGDLMCDPELVLEIHPDLSVVEVLTFRNDYIGLYQEVYNYDENGKKSHVKLKLKTQLNQFLSQWLNNLKQQGFGEIATQQTGGR